MKRISRLVVAVAPLIILSACGGGATTPTIDPPADGCTATNTTVNITVVYKRNPANVSATSITIPEVAQQNLGSGNAIFYVMTKVDYFTWTKTLSVPVTWSAAIGKALHVMWIADNAIPPPATLITASDIYINGVAIAKGPDRHGNIGEYGYYTVTACGTVYPVT
jgi:hypothetical protein